jgi:hypothetical protein
MKDTKRERAGAKDPVKILKAASLDLQKKFKIALAWGSVL